VCHIRISVGFLTDNFLFQQRLGKTENLNKRGNWVYRNILSEDKFSCTPEDFANSGLMVVPKIFAVSRWGDR